jgi:dTDP-4-amino-4,6-dideoxygalactose transaminase
VNIPFNKPYSTGKELKYIEEAISSYQTSGNGPFSRRCHNLLSSIYGFKSPLLTSSCTDALEMCAILIDIKPGDEVIVPAYTFVSTALAFARQGANIVFADSRNDNPCVDEGRIEALITEKTKAIVPVHYAGISCEMDKIMEIAAKYNLWVIEDAAHAFGAKYKGRLLGTIGHLGCFSFHETKIIHCGEGGLLSVNDGKFVARAEIIWEKGTNRFKFYQGKVQKYEWLDTGSSFLMSDISAAFLLAQLEETKSIINHRERQWRLYFNELSDLENRKLIQLPHFTVDSEINYSGFYIIVTDFGKAEKLKSHLNSIGIQVLSHYLDLGLSPYISKFQPWNHGYINTNSVRYQNVLLRLPLYHDLSDKSIVQISDYIKDFYIND